MAIATSRDRIVTTAHRVLTVLEPWYDWGIFNVERMEGSTRDRDGGYGDVRYFQLQWFGIHIAVQFGRTPKRGY